MSGSVPDARDFAFERVRAGHAFGHGSLHHGQVSAGTEGSARVSLPLLPPIHTEQVHDPQGDALAARLGIRIQQLFRRSLHIRHLDAGSCNGCDWEIQALLGPAYDIQRLGIDIVASPRHADLLLVTGSVTRNLESAARLTYEAMPEPRLVVAVGACACGGGVLQGSYCTAGGVNNVLPVDVFIPGCPPRPLALIHGLLVALGRVEPKLRRAELTIATVASEE
jgi:Ni,Fe-hydrogenase III small subunit